MGELLSLPQVAMRLAKARPSTAKAAEAAPAPTVSERAKPADIHKRAVPGLDERRAKVEEQQKVAVTPQKVAAPTQKIAAPKVETTEDKQETLRRENIKKEQELACKEAE